MGGMCRSSLCLSFVFFHGSCSFFVLVVSWRCIEPPPPPPPTPPTHLVSRTCLSASLLAENGQRFAGLQLLLFLLLSKGNVRAERQLLFKEINFKYCCQTKKKTTLEPARQLTVCRTETKPAFVRFCSIARIERHHAFLISDSPTLSLQSAYRCAFISAQINWCK